MSETKRNRIYSIVIYVLGILFFFLYQGKLEWVMGGDSLQFLSFGYTDGVMPMPLYPLFLKFMYTIFGESNYLFYVVVVQCLFAGLSVGFFVDYIRKHFKLKIIETLVIFFFSVCPFLLLLPEDPIGRSIMTEAISYPMFYIYMVFILKSIYENKKRYLYASILLIVITALARPQMKFLFAVTGLAYLYMMIKNRIQSGIAEKRYLVKFIIFCAVLLCSLKSITIVADVYQRIQFNTPSSNYSYMALVERALYACDPEDEALFEEKYLKEIFRKTYVEMEEHKSNYRYKGDGLGSWNDIVRGTTTCSRIVGAKVREYLRETGVLSDDPVMAEVQVSKIFGEIGTVLVKDNLKQYLIDSIKLMPAGFVSTVGFHKESIYGLLHIATVCLYLAAFVLIFILYRFKNCNREIGEYLAVIVITAMINVIASNLVLFGLQRYLAYTLGMFYIGLFLAVRDILAAYLNKKSAK